MRTSNPALKTSTFAQFRQDVGRDQAEAANVMTVQGTAQKTGLLVVLTVAAAVFTWKLFFATLAQAGGGMEGIMAARAAVTPFMIGGFLGGLGVALLLMFKPRLAPFLAPVYAIVEGLALGGFSGFAEVYVQAYGASGVVFQALGLTIGVLVVMLGLYATRTIKVTSGLVKGVAAATGAIFLVYMLSWILGMFGIAIPFIHSNGLLGIGFSLFVVGLAAFNLLLDFKIIEDGANAKAPKWMEWFGAFGLLVTLVWLYIELVRLLMKLTSRD